MQPNEPTKSKTAAASPAPAKSVKPASKTASGLRAGLRDPKRAAIALLLLACLSLGFLGGWLGSRSRSQSSSLDTAASKQIVTTQSQLINQIAKDVGPSVVSVDVTTQTTQTNFFGFDNAVEQQAAGTGIIISADGVVMTNRHVVPAGTNTVSVTLSDGTKLDNVSVIGRTSETDPLDVAFLKINDKKGKTLKAATLGDSSAMQVGDMVVAIGNALGQFQNTVTSGIISGYGRSVQAGEQSSNSAPETLQNLFQTDAAINQGNSGGPLVNSDGQVIGINTAIAGDAQNIGFAIPVNDLKGLINSVLNKGKLERPYLGVRYVSLTDDIAYQYNLSTKRGAYLAPGGGTATIISGSPADKAGLQEKDIITKINDTAVDETHSLTSLLGQHQVGDKVTLTIVRDGKTITVPVTLEAAPTQ